MKQKSLLLVDDEQIVLDSLARELTYNNSEYKVTLATSGKDAISKINTDCFDLVVTDLLMPEIDGFQILKAAKRKSSQIMVIILTGYGDMEAAVDALRLGADDFLIKPCDFEELIFRMSNCFVKQDLQRKVALYENFLPVCSYCKKIRDDRKGEHGKGHWYSLEEYFSKAKGVAISHGCCPDCFVEQTKKLLTDED